MALPKQVEAAGIRADDLVKEINENTDPARPVEPAHVDDPDKEKPAPAEEGGTTDWKHKFEVLQGKYNKEVKELRDNQNTETTRLRSENANLAGQIVELSKSLSELNTKIADLQAKKELEPKPAAPAPPKLQLSDDEKEYLRAQDLDEKVLDILSRAVGFQGGPDPQISDRLKKLETSAAEGEKREQKTNYDKFVNDVKSAVSGLGYKFDTVNNSPLFMEWLSHPVSQFLTMTRHQALNDAAARLDSSKAVELFKAFIDENQTKLGKPDPVNDPSHDPNTDPLAKEIEPSSTATSKPAETDPGKGQKFSTSEVQKFYSDMAMSEGSGWNRGEWAGKEKECRERDAQIKQASVDGRIYKG